MSSQPHRNSLRHRVEAYERRLIEEALCGTRYHQRHAAAALGILPSTLCEKMKRLGIPSRQHLLAALAVPRPTLPAEGGPGAPSETEATPSAP